MAPRPVQFRPFLPSRRLAACAICGAASFIAACAGTAAPLRDAGAAPAWDAPYGEYLAALWADSVQSPADAARFYREALEKDPGNAMLVEEAFHASLLAADWANATPLAQATLETEPANQEARLTLAVDAMARGQNRRAARMLEGVTFGPIDDLSASLILAWAQAGRGDEAAALAALGSLREPALFGALMGLHQGMVMDRAGDPGAEAALAVAIDVYALPAYAVREYGRYLERRGRPDDARAAYLRRLASSPADRIVEAELARLNSGGAPARTQPAEAAALALYAAAATLVGRDFSDRAQTYLVMAVRLDGDFAPARMLLGHLMVDQRRYDEAASMLTSIARDPVMGVEARISLAELEATRGDAAASEDILRRLWEENGGEEAARALAGALRATEQWAEAEVLWSELIAAREAGGLEPDWSQLYGRAVARERQGKWTEAEADFRAAIALNRDNALLLNYLGYAMVDRGENLEEGFELIRRAVALAPRAGFIIDSLGWAYYRLGDYEDAVEQLETAAALEPGAADINDHLGDAYWRVGRQLEARFQWRRALTLDPDPELAESVRDKLRDGLPPAPTPPSLAENQ